MEEQEPINRFRDEHTFLSNFHPSPVVMDGMAYRTVEHAYQAAKTRDKQERKRIQAEHCAANTKTLGRKVSLRPDWEDVKLDTMLSLLRKKFMIPDLRSKLLATGDRHLEEGNWWGDVFWGVDSRSGEGENWLGVLLMQVREEVREQEQDGEDEEEG